MQNGSGTQKQYFIALYSQCLVETLLESIYEPGWIYQQTPALIPLTAPGTVNVHFYK